MYTFVRLDFRATVDTAYNRGTTDLIIEIEVAL